MTGIRFLATLPTAVSRLSVSCPISASLRARPVSQLSHAALAVLMLPSMVVAASLAVVPVMPKLSCTA